MTRRTVVIGAVALGAAMFGRWALGDPGATDPGPATAPGKYFGASSCEGSSCHSKTAPRTEPPYLQEYTSWSALKPDGMPYDAHSFAWKQLREKGQGADPRSKEIMTKLNAAEGTHDTAETSERCLTCHGVAVHDFGKSTAGLAVGKHKELQGGKFKPDDGVSCDGCHGPAEKWLKPHEGRDWTVKKWKELGGNSKASLQLYETYGIYYSKDLELWAGQCIRCHLSIDTTLLDAGHPDIQAFELFGHNQQVPHWRDYSTAPEGAKELPAAGPFHAATAWQSGQAAAFHAAVKQVGERAAGKNHNKPTPEHLKNAFERAKGHYVVFRHALDKVAPAQAAAIRNEMENLERLFSGEVQADRIVPVAEKLVGLSKPLVRAMADAKLDQGILQGLIADVAGDPEGLASTRSAEQTAKALYALQYSWLQKTKPDALTADPPTDPVLKSVYEMLSSPDPRAKACSDALERIRSEIRKR